MSQTSSPAGSTHNGLLVTLTIIAALGGLLFCYDSAVISGGIVTASIGSTMAMSGTSE